MDLAVKIFNLSNSPLFLLNYDHPIPFTIAPSELLRAPTAGGQRRGGGDPGRGAGAVGVSSVDRLDGRYFIYRHGSRWIRNKWQDPSEVGDYLDLNMSFESP